MFFSLQVVPTTKLFCRLLRILHVSAGFRGGHLGSGILGWKVKSRRKSGFSEPMLEKQWYIIYCIYTYINQILKFSRMDVGTRGLKGHPHKSTEALIKCRFLYQIHHFYLHHHIFQVFPCPKRFRPIHSHFGWCILSFYATRNRVRIQWHGNSAKMVLTTDQGDEA